MAGQPWQSIYAEKLVSAAEALQRIKSGYTIFIASGASEPLLLTHTLADMAGELSDIEIIQLFAPKKGSRLADPSLSGSFRYNTFYQGCGVSERNVFGHEDFIPINLAELPRAIEREIIRIDAALIQVSPPNPSGLCSLGVSVDASKTAVEHASLVIAQVNEKMPETFGDSLIPVSSIDFLVAGNAELVEVPPVPLDPVSLTIGRHIAGLIRDGMTLHFDGGPCCAAAMRYLDTRKDLGIHTDIITDDIMRLIRSGAITNQKKQLHKGKIVATMALGSRDLYNALHGNPRIELHPIDHIEDPAVIALNDNMVSILSVDRIDLTGSACVTDEHFQQAPSLPSGMDFMDGAMRSKNGFSIIALPSTTADGLESRIVALSPSNGAGLLRTKTQYVVTEYGVVNLYGLSIRERAIALISIAHPKFRQELLEEARKLNYIGSEENISVESGRVYPHHYEFRRTFDDGLEVFFRPVQPGDARRLQRLFYSLSPESVRLRYHGSKKNLSRQEAQKLAAVDYSKDMAILALVGPTANPICIGEGRYTFNPSNRMGEFDIIVHEDYRRRGLATMLADYLKKIAYANGLAGMYADVIQQNASSMALLAKAWPTAEKTFDSGICTFTVRFPEEDVARPKDSIIIYSGRFGDFSYGPDHPLDPGRARVALSTITQHGFLNEPWMRVQEPTMIQKETLIQSHAPELIAALEKANSGKWSDEFFLFNLGTRDCPVFPGLFDYVLLYSSATATAVDLIMNENANVVFNLLGGFHHSSRSHVEGFCYVNDVILAIDRFLAGGYRVAYIDIDAHHCNGVQDAYYADDRVLVVSLHESGMTLYPGTGFETEIGRNGGRGFTVNVPLPAGSDDEIFQTAFDRVVTPAVEAFAPSVVVAVIGADTHRVDPLAHLNLTNNGMVYAMERIRDYCNHLLLLGGGGYDTQTVARAWARMWAAANRLGSLPDYLLVLGGTFLGGHGVEGALVDMSYRESGETKTRMQTEIERIIRFHEENTLPLIRQRKKQEQNA